MCVVVSHVNLGYTLIGGIFAMRNDKPVALVLYYNKPNSRGLAGPQRLHMVLCDRVPQCVWRAAVQSHRTG